MYSARSGSRRADARTDARRGMLKVQHAACGRARHRDPSRRTARSGAAESTPDLVASPRLDSPPSAQHVSGCRNQTWSVAAICGGVRAAGGGRERVVRRTERLRGRRADVSRTEAGRVDGCRHRDASR